MAKKEYISVNSQTNESSQLVKMTNAENEFTGKLMSSGPDGGAQDVRNLFISELRVDGQQVDETFDENNKRIVDIHIPDVTPVNPTKVFTATDPSGSSSIDSLVLTPSEEPSQGDILIVSHALENGAVENSAYIYSNGWKACSGNVDASKVILTQNFRKSGRYDKVGNFENDGNEIQSKGRSVQDLLEEMFYVELPPAIYFIGEFQRRNIMSSNDVQNLAVWQLNQLFTSFETLPEEFSVANARQVLILVPDTETRNLKANTSEGLPYAVTKLNDVNLNIDENNYFAFQILQDKSFTDSIKFSFA